MIKVGIIGATGYAGAELVRILLAHPMVKLTKLSSVSFEGKAMSEVYPSLKSLCDDVLVNQDDVIEACDVIFAALPHGLSEPTAKACFEAGKLFIDIGADFRLNDEATYQKWYDLPFKYPELHKNAVYALPELFRKDITKDKIIANPGCYPTSAALALAPALCNKFIDPTTIIIDSKSGATGAGRGLTLTSHYPECNEAFSPYKVASHRHTPEIEQTLSILAGEDVKITFVPHLLPLNRGIISTVYATLTQKLSVEQVITAYTEFYKDEIFVRVLENGKTANLKTIKCSNFCDISLHLDEHTNRLIIVSTLDNMVKGAAGQAIQNMNIALGLEETTGLMMAPPAF
ncbi:MAG: N-acetyl-gamma-glutamyl-phosphate reductase [Oscillospiraceae bacterium]